MEIKTSTYKEKGTATVYRQSTFTSYRPDAGGTARTTEAAAKYQMDPIPEWLSKVNLCKCYLFVVTAVHQQLHHHDAEEMQISTACQVVGNFLEYAHTSHGNVGGILIR